MAIFLYARVSTAEQTLDHQRTQAEALGYQFDHIIADHGVSGVAVKMKDRPQGKRLFDMLRSGDTLVVRWIDRLGRNYDDVCYTIKEFMRRGVTVRTVINAMAFDGKTQDPMSMAVRDAMIGFLAAMAQAQSESTKEAQRAGIAFAKRRDASDGRSAYLGRKPSFDTHQVSRVMELLSQGIGPSAIAAQTGLSRQTVYRIKANPDAAFSSLALWN